MNTRGLLDQLLKSGQDLLQNKAGSSQQKGASGGNGAPRQLALRREWRGIGGRRHGSAARQQKGP